MVSEVIVEQAMTKHDRYRISLDTVIALSQYVDVAAIRSNTRAYRLSRQLMQHDNLSRMVGFDDAERWYEDVRPFYEWNGRFWDQRALLASDHEDYASARSYAERSVRMDPHPFATNTLGTVLMHIAAHTGDTSELLEAISALRESKDSPRRREWYADEHPYVTFFRGCIRFAERVGYSAIPAAVKLAWATWYSEAGLDAEFAFNHSDDLVEWDEAWRRLSSGR